MIKNFPGFCVSADENPQVLLLEPIDDKDIAFLHRELDFLHAQSGIPFVFAGVLIEDWNRDLTPWASAPVWGKEAFGDRADDTLHRIQADILPFLEAQYPALAGAPRILGGYSLAGLFALWASYESALFDGIAAASPSVWYPGWREYIGSHYSHANHVYLSLGEAEPKSRNKTVATVGEVIREQERLLSAQGTETVLIWNPGNHFTEADLRTAKAFLWAMTRLIPSRP